MSRRRILAGFTCAPAASTRPRAGASGLCAALAGKVDASQAGLELRAGSELLWTSGGDDCDATDER